MKKLIALLLCAAMVIALTACGSTPAAPKSESPAEPAAGAPAEARVLKLGHSVTETSAWHQGALLFAEKVAEKTNGSIKIEIYPNCTLGSEREMIEGMGLGSVDMGLVSTSIASGFTDSMLLMDMPFLFNDFEHAHKVIDSEIGEGILASAEEIGIHGLTFFENGFRNIQTVAPVTCIDDIAGMKIRTVESTMYLDTLEAFGANPIPMTWTDVYTGVQQKTIDGLEGCNDNDYKAGLGEVAKYVICTNQIYSGVILGINTEIWYSLTAEEQTAMTEAAQEAVAYQRELAEANEMTARESLIADGVQVISEEDIADIDAWKAAVEPIYEAYADRVGGWDLINSIREMA